jgi:excisionase family DNA binding protein
VTGADLSTADVGALLGVSMETVRRLVSRGELTGVKTTVGWNFSMDEVDRFLAGTPSPRAWSATCTSTAGHGNVSGDGSVMPARVPVTGPRHHGVMATITFIPDHCANCDAELSPEVEGLFCGDFCRLTAEHVRYARGVTRDGRIQDPLVREALRTREAMLLGGGYPESARRLSPKTRAAVIERDGGLCVQCGAPGTEIDHIAGNSGDPGNLRLLCHLCHQAITDSHMRPATAEESAWIKTLWDSRILPALPTRLCDDEQNWRNEARRLKSERRQQLLDLLDSDYGLSRSDFKGQSWAEMWESVLDVGEFGDGSTGTIEDYEHGQYLRDLAERDD